MKLCPKCWRKCEEKGISVEKTKIPRKVCSAIRILTSSSKHQRKSNISWKHEQNCQNFYLKVILSKEKVSETYHLLLIEQLTFASRGEEIQMSAKHFWTRALAIFYCNAGAIKIKAPQLNAQFQSNHRSECNIIVFFWEDRSFFHSCL